ncbi:MAG TPA: efflux transporter outer membrane subunit [Gemmatimonadaceae bacterium]|nr:efflux transporter outer membrane subunit [Gemmatimonadaceae bacterium]
MAMMRTAAAALAALALAGCMVGPKYERPTVPTPAGFRGADSAHIADSAKSIADVAWFDYFRDTTLQRLVHEALAGNFDLTIATSRVAQAQAQYGIARSPLYPQVGLGAAASANQLSTAANQVPAGGNRYPQSYQANLGLSWELDLWGRVRSLSASAQAQYLATEEARRGVLVSLVAEVSQAYFDLRELDLELAIAYGTLKTRQGTLQLFQQRFEGGVASGLEVSQAQGDVAFTQTTIPALQRQIAQQENFINFLLGRGPGPVARPTAMDTTFALPAIPVGLPSQLLERRPDVMAAEDQLISANADVGVAKANFFPQISLTGLFGVASATLGDLGSTNALIASAGGTLLQPIFTGGRIKQSYALALARRDEAVAQYLKAAQNAFRESSDALIGVQRAGEVRFFAEQQAAALKEGARLARVRYDGGLSNYLEVLDADRRYYQAQNELARAMGTQADAYVELYRALGGGWNADSVKN